MCFGRALMRALAATASLPCTLHLLEITCRAWKLSFLRKRTCCDATSELILGLIEGCGCGSVVLWC
jgi:hypothetical protein